MYEFWTRPSIGGGDVGIGNIESIFFSNPKCPHLDSRSTHHSEELLFSSTPGH